MCSVSVMAPHRDYSGQGAFSQRLFFTEEIARSLVGVVRVIDRPADSSWATLGGVAQIVRDAVRVSPMVLREAVGPRSAIPIGWAIAVLRAVAIGRTAPLTI